MRRLRIRSQTRNKRPEQKPPRVKKGMTIEQAEAIMGIGQREPWAGKSAWMGLQGNGQPVRVYVKVKDGKSQTRVWHFQRTVQVE